MKNIPLKRELVYKKYGHLIPYRYVEIPVEHRSNKKNPHSLRCFRMRYQRDKDGNVLKDEPRVRCKKPVVEGYLYCSRHGGKRKNGVAVAKKEENTTTSIYRNVYDAEMGDLLISFLNDPQILDLKPDLANLRLILNNYIKKLLQKPRAHDMRNFMSEIRDILIDEESDENKKFKNIVELVESLNTITSGKSIDRVNRCVEQIGKTIERIHKYETKDNFLLTPEGLKIFLRALVDLLDKAVADDKIKEKIREELLTLSIKTKGDVSQYHTEKPVDVEIVE